MSATSITKADGEVITLTYHLDSNGHTVAPKSVSSSLGWSLWYDVDASNTVDKVTAFNSSAVYCDPNGSSCSVSSSFPYATMTTSGSTKTISRNGVNVLSYTVGGGITTITSPNGVTKTVNTYPSGTYSGRVSSVVVGGSTWSYGYAASGSNTVATVTEPAVNGVPHTHSITFSGYHQIVAQTDEAGRTTSYQYDGDGDLVKVINPDGDPNTGGFTAYQYKFVGVPDKETIVPRGGATSGNPISGVAIITSSTFVTACDVSGSATDNSKYCTKPLSTTDANGVVTTYSYDTNSGQVLTVLSSAPASGQARPLTTYTISAVTPYVMNSSGGLVAQNPVYRQTHVSTCRTADNGNCVNTSDERQTSITYSGSNLLPISTIVSLGDGTLAQTSTVTYNNNGQVIVTDGPKPGGIDETYAFYDALGRQTGTVGLDPDGAAGANHRQASHTYYDADGHVSEVDTGIVGTGNIDAYSGGDPISRWGQAQSDWNGLTVQERNTNEFDGYGRPDVARHYIGTSSTAKDVTQRSYDTMQRVDCEAVRMNPTAALPSSACTLGTAGSDGTSDRITKNGYDSIGNLVSTISGYGTSMARTDATKHYDVDSATGSGTLQYVTDAKGNRTGYTYDDFDRLISTCYPTADSGSTTNVGDCDQTAYRNTTVTGTSQATNLVDHVTLRDGQTIGFTYDALGRVSSKTGAVSETYTYDNFNDVITHVNYTTGGAAASETYGYNALGWLMSDAQPMGTVSYQYDAYGRRSRMTYPFGFYVGYVYDNGDELTGLLENGGFQMFTFVYDDYGRREYLWRGNSVTTAYGYDSNLRLGSMTQGSSGDSFFNQVSYGYNAADQINSKTGTNTAYDYHAAANSVSYGIDGLNRIASVNGTGFTYDGRGNMTSDGGSDAYTYNANNLMTSATQSGVTTSLTYDAENRLLSVAKNGTTTKFLYDGTDSLVDYDGSGNVLRVYVHGPGDDEPLVSYDVTNGWAKSYLHADDNGSIDLITHDGGGQAQINTYDAYGLPGSGNTGRFQYTGQAWVPEIGMYYYKARLYSPILGRFMQTDPIGYADGMNWYNYVGGDPVNGRDPSGLNHTSFLGYSGGCVDYSVISFIGNTIGSDGAISAHYGQQFGSFCPGEQMQQYAQSMAQSVQQTAHQVISIGADFLKNGSQRECPKGSVASFLRGTGKVLRDSGSSSAAIGVGVAAGGYAAGTAGAVTGDVPLAGVGVIVAEKGDIIAARGEAVTAAGVLLSSIGGDDSGAADLVLGRIVNGENFSKIPFTNKLPAAWKDGIEKGIDGISISAGQRLDGMAKKYLGCIQ